MRRALALPLLCSLLLPRLALAADAKTLLADDKKVSAYLTYKRQMVPHSKLAVDMATGAYQQGARDGQAMGDKVQKDARMAEFNKAHQAALAASGLSEDELNLMMPPLSSYAPQLSLAREAQKEVEALQAKKQSGKLSKLEEKTLARKQERAEKFKGTQAEFAKAYGQAALDAVTRHEAEFLEIQAASMKNVLGQ